MRDSQSMLHLSKEAAILLMLNAAGSVESTSGKPKFALRSTIKKCFPRIAESIKPSGEYTGSIPIIQGDRAGPHQDGDFVSF